MINSVVVVGKLKNIEFHKLSSVKGKLFMELDNISYLDDGSEKHNLIPVHFYMDNKKCHQVTKTIKENTLVGIKGKIEIEDDVISIIAEKFTYYVPGKEVEE